MNDIKGIIEDVEKSSLVSDKVIKRVIEIIGQEEWNDIHDDESDICTTTGELIITLKGIADLEKENAELKADNDARKFAMAMSEKVEKQLRNERNTFLAQNEQYEKDLIDFKGNLTKATELLRKLVLEVTGYEEINGYDTCEPVQEAEQFLKEVEK